MTHFAFGLVWLSIALILLFQQQANLQNSGMLAAFAGLLAVYNFLRFGVNWANRRRRRAAQRAYELPKCPKCGRSMKPVDLGEGLPTEKERWQFVCCGYQMQIEDDEERRRIIKLHKAE